MKKYLIALILIFSCTLCFAQSGVEIYKPMGNTGGGLASTDINTIAKFNAIIDPDVVDINSSQTILNKVVDGNGNIIKMLLHATDCTTLTAAVDGQYCWEQDADLLYVCETADVCDTAAEWDAVANPTAGRSLTAPSAGTIDADPELYTDTKCANIDPTNATTTDWFVYRTDVAITITGVDCIVDAATSVILTPNECDGNGGTCSAIEAAITCVATNTTEATSIDNASIDAGDYIRVTRGTVTGSPKQATICLTFTVND